MIKSKWLNNISLPISKQTLSDNLLTPLVNILNNIYLVNEKINQGREALEQLKQLTYQLQIVCNELRLSSEDILKFAQCVIEQAQVREIKDKGTTNSDNLKKDKWLSILVVEDNLIIQKIHRELLESLNCNVDIVDNGYQALNSIDETHDAVLMDIDMPGINGIETAKKIRQLGDKLQIIPIIAVTTNQSATQDINKEQVFNAFIKKPININQLQELLTSLVSQ